MITQLESICNGGTTVLVLRVKDGEMVRLEPPGCDPITLKIKCTSGKAIKLGIDGPRSCQVSRIKKEDGSK